MCVERSAPRRGGDELGQLDRSRQPGEIGHGHPPRAVSFVGLSENPDAMLEVPTGARPDTGPYSEAVGTRLNNLPARSWESTAPLSS
jgi:hypothetical protein